MQLTIQQEQCIKTIQELYNQKQKIITIAGVAGSGKTTIVPYIIDTLKLWDNVAFVTYTGKASLVLRQKGIPATTIHHLIYDCKKIGWDTYIFTLKPEISKKIKLIIIDEISMVPKELLIDLLKFNRPIITFGDHCQLKPVGEDNGLLKHPDFVLTEVIRQAEDNPIIYLSKLIREEKFAYINTEQLKVLSPKDFDYSMLNWADQCICGYNSTRQVINNNMRYYLYNSNYKYPQIGDKLISLKNYWDRVDSQNNPLINGALYTVRNSKFSNYKLECKLEDIDTHAVFEKININSTIFLGRQGKTKYPIFDYGYAITVHKAQGSEWNKILIIDEKMPNYHKWLYTALTRAKEECIIIKQ